MEKAVARNKFDSLRNRLPLVMAVFILNYLLSFIMDEEYASWMLGGQMTFIEYGIDFGMTLLFSFLFVEMSVFYCKLLFRYIPFSRNHYRGLFIYALLLLVFNNLTAVLFSFIVDYLFDGGVLFFYQMLYAFCGIVTFVSYIYTNAIYVEFIFNSERQKKELEITLLKEKEHSAKTQLEVLKSQIDSHFMFNNFSILSELIVEDRGLAEKFLENMSNVYRYVIQNLKRNTVPVCEEMKFLHSYIYLIKIRYEDAIHISIDEDLQQTEGQIPPVCLQLLVENAIKHNRLSVHEPLHIHIFRKYDHIIVENDLHPLASELTSTGIGQRNIIERYFLLCAEKPIFMKSDNSYTVKLPIIIE